MNSFGRIFRVHIYGESHGEELGILIDGCPAGLSLELKDFLGDLARRKGGKKGTTARVEDDVPQIKSGIFHRRTTGAPLLVEFKNTDIRTEDYEQIKDIPRPGHADFCAIKKFEGYHDWRGGGHFSGRLTAGLVVAGVVAKKIIAPATVKAKVIEAGGTRDIQRAVEKALKDNDSIGAIIECRVRGLPVGLGEPFFDSVESMIAHIVFSIPGIKGIEFGSGFASAGMRGSQHNDLIVDTEGKTKTNHAGGINGGLTNGNPLLSRVAVKPTPSISRIQRTINLKTGLLEDLEIRGRHDICFALRLPVVLEAAAAVVLADFLLLERISGRVLKSNCRDSGLKEKGGKNDFPG